MPITNLTKTQISRLKDLQLKEILLNNQIDLDTVDKLNRTEKIEKIKAMMDLPENTIENLSVEKEGKLEIVGIVTDTNDVSPKNSPVHTTEDDNTIPLPSSIEWTDFILSKFDKDELINKHPTCDGLRRIFEIYAGEILQSHIDVLQTPSVDNLNRATVKCTLKYRDYRSNIIKEISDATDVSIANTDVIYAKFPVATACTVAESRCLRKGLRLKVISKEEASQPSNSEQKIADAVMEGVTPASDTQKNAIKIICQRLGINPISLFNNIPTITSKNFEMLTMQDAQEVMKTLNDYGRSPDDGGKIIPDVIKS